MVLLTVSNLNKYFGAEELFSNITFAVKDKDRVALIGENGTGKTTILKIILGQDESTKADSQLAFAKGIKYGYLSQDVIKSVDNTLLQEATDVFKDLIEKELELEGIALELSKDPNNDKLTELYGTKEAEFSRLGGYEYRYKINMVLSKFGFDEETCNRPIRTFSGGERTKMAFAKLLLIAPELLILDEPTNHLDVSTIDWLENYLKSYEGAILFVSHDRYFINTLATSVIELENKRITEYSGNFDDYLRIKKENYESSLKAYKLQQKEIAKIKRFIEYYMPKPRFVSRAHDREKKLEHMKVLTEPNSSSKAISFSFEGEGRQGKKIMLFKDVEIGYDTTLVNPFSLYLFGNDKLAIMGDNGTGKTTLLKSIVNNTPTKGGEIIKLADLNIGYIRQNDFDLEGSDESLAYMCHKFPDMGEKKMRNHLGKFGFEGDDVFKSIGVLSGGEKMRLVLATIVLNNYDLLILDEPTNHLDLLSKEALVKAMQDFEGAIIFVSHDRYFIEQVANKILYFDKKEPFFIEGGYQEFKEALEKKEGKSTIKTKETPKKSAIKEEAKPIKVNPKVLVKLEQELFEIESKLEDIAYQMDLEENNTDYVKMSELASLREELELNYDSKFKEYAKLSEENK